MSYFHVKIHLKPHKLIVDETYLICNSINGIRYVRFVRSTSKGYNFLNIKTNKLIYKTHMYPSKESQHVGKNELWFWLPHNLIVVEASTALPKNYWVS